MIVLQCINISKAYIAEPVLKNVKLEVQTGDRIALVGRNGAGKSTLLKLITGELKQDDGQIIIPKGTQIGYLEQHSGLTTDRSIWDEMLTVFKPLQLKEAKLRELEQTMADETVIQNESRYEKLMKEYDELQIEFKDEGGYQYEADIRSILSGLNFSQFDYSTKISTLSGGQRTRLALAKLLLSKPDLLILDEPTNHLDIDTLTWLEQFLKAYSGAILLVSHDRYFLDQIVNGVVELSRHQSTSFHGNYSHYLDQKAARFEQELKQYEKQQEEVAKLEDFIARNLVRASTTKRAQSRRKQLEKMDRLDRPDGLEKSASFSFAIERQSGNDVLTVNDLSLSFSGQPILSDLHLALTRAESVALIGPNGAGKSTLLKAIVNKLTPDSGTIRFGSQVKIGYYDQIQADLQSNKTVLNELWDEHTLLPEKEIRTVLGNFLFSGDDVLKPVNALSGGEKARLALAKLMMQKANVLILDEPTNHLDLDAKEVLEAALIDYPGTLLFVSHDRYFLNRLTTRTVELSEGKLTSYLGDYDYYLEKKEEQQQFDLLKEPQKATSVETEQPSIKTSYSQDKEAKKLERQRTRRISAIETEMTDLEQTINRLETDLCEPDIFADHVRAADIQKELDQANQMLEALMEEWEALQTEEV